MPTTTHNSSFESQALKMHNDFHIPKCHDTMNFYFYFHCQLIKCSVLGRYLNQLIQPIILINVNPSISLLHDF